MIKRLKHTARLFALSGMIMLSSAVALANTGCNDGTQCPDGSFCGEVAEPHKSIGGDYDAEEIREGLWNTGSYVCLSETSGGDAWYRIDGTDLYLSESDAEDVMSDNALGNELTTTVFFEVAPVPLTDAILPLTLALGVYSWVIRRRRKKQ